MVMRLRRSLANVLTGPAPRRDWIPGWDRYGVPLAFALLALPVFLLVAFLVVRAEQSSSTETLIRSTEIQNASLARVLANAHADAINYLLAFDIGDAPELLPLVVRRSGLEARVRESLVGTNLVDLKIHDGDGVTLFSLKPALLGTAVSSLPCFAKALEGNIVSELNAADAPELGPHDGHIHPGVNRDVFRTMIRIDVLAPGLGETDGVLEVETDISHLLGVVHQARTDVMFQAGLPLAALYLVLVVIVCIVHFAIRRRDREALQLATEAAESDAANRAKSEFLALMSHELRTPLNAIIGFSELIEHTGMKDARADTVGYARTIHESGHHMLRQITSILDMTAIELGELELDIEPMYLDVELRAAAGNIRDRFERSDVVLDLADAPTIGPVRGDRRKLCQVFENLLSNAVRFTPAGGRVIVSFGSEPGGWVFVAIADTGAGMTRKQIARARKPFQHDWNGLSREAEGAGIGLTIADRVVALLGGELLIESEQGAGTIVTVRLPLTDEPVDTGPDGYGVAAE